MSTIKRHRPLELPGYCLARGASEKGRKNASGSLAGHRGHRRSHRSSSRARVIPWPGSSCVSAGTVSHWSTGSWRSDHSRRYILWPPWTVPDEDTLASVCTSVRVRGHAGWKSRPAIIYALVICHNRRPPPYATWQYRYGLTETPTNLSLSFSSSSGLATRRQLSASESSDGISPCSS